MSFDLQGAKKAGYSDAEIADHLGQSAGFDVAGARSAGYSDADIVKHLSGPGPSMGARVMSGVKEAAGAVGDAFETAGNYRDTQFSKAMGGVAGLPRLAADVTKWVGDKTGVPVGALPIIGPAMTAASHLPTGQDASKAMLGVAAARPDFKETNLNPIVDAGVQALFAGPLLGAGGRMGPLVNAAGAMGSEGAGQLTEGTNLEPYARIAGGVAGGVAPYALAKGGKAAMSLVEPFTAGGREKIVSQALNKSAADAPAAITRMENYSPPVPGFQIPAGKASRDPGLMAIEEVASAKTPAMRGIQDKNNVLLMDEIKGMQANLPPAETAGPTIQQGLRDRFDALSATRSSKAGPLYDAARKSATPVDPTDALAAAAKVAETAVDKPQALAKTFQRYLQDPKATTPEGLMAIRDAITNRLDDLSLPKFSKSILMDVRSKVDDAMAVVPEEGAARATFQKYSKPLEPFDASKGNKVVADAIAKDRFGTDFTMPAEKVPSQFIKPGDLSAPMMQKFITASGGDIKSVEAMRAYVIEDFKKAAGSRVAGDAQGNARLTANGAATWIEKNKGAAANVLTPDQTKSLEAITAALKDQAATITGRTGSPTFDRMASESIIGAILSPKFADSPILHPINKALGLAYGGANEAAMNRLFEVIQDPKAAAALMKKANAGNVKMIEPVLGTIAKSLPVSQAGGQ